MTQARRASRRATQRPATQGRAKFSSSVDPLVLAEIRGISKRQSAQVCEVMERALRRLVEEDTATRSDATIAPLIDRVIETRLKNLEGGLRTMIARLAYEALTLQYVMFNFLVEANIPASKVEKWRTDGRKFAIQEYRRRPREMDEGPTEDED